MKKIAILSIVLASLLLAIKPVAAHELVTDGSIGAVLHIEPEDDPIIGQTSSLYFEFKDKTNKFDPAKCNCDATISLNGKELIRHPLFTPGTKDLTSANFTYIFQQKGKYVIEASGTPTEADVFQPFHLRYEIPVERTGNNKSASTAQSTYKWIAFAATAVIFAGLLLFNRKK